MGRQVTWETDETAVTLHVAHKPRSPRRKLIETLGSAALFAIIAGTLELADVPSSEFIIAAAALCIAIGYGLVWWSRREFCFVILDDEEVSFVASGTNGKTSVQLPTSAFDSVVIGKRIPGVILSAPGTRTLLIEGVPKSEREDVALRLAEHIGAPACRYDRVVLGSLPAFAEISGGRISPRPAPSDETQQGSEL